MRRYRRRPMRKEKAARDGLAAGSDGAVRCFWCAGDPLYESYHDREWGHPVRDDVRLFEKICLEGFQAGLSWITVLRKREAFRSAFHGFEPERVARMNGRDVARLLRDPGIIRHRQKLESAVNNAKRTLELIEERGSLAAYLWTFEPDAKERPKRITWPALGKLTESAASRALSKDLRQRGFSFVGPTTMYAMMQAMGLVNDHLEGCPVRERALAARTRFRLPR
ncbi:MAG TPA: DNA-3-methyladenine glycosylase I [Myxococcota bacterium]|nr:DNA-3-methyladenine glycosylase I [Myxococcota bacterium]